MGFKKPVLADRIKEEIAEIKGECRVEGHNLAERLAVELNQAQHALMFVQNDGNIQPGASKDYVVNLHTARIDAFEIELLKLAKDLKA